MQRYRLMFRLGALLLLVGGALIQVGNAQQWERLALGGGGVVWDVAEARSWRNMTYDPVWAACGNSGIYRAHWQGPELAWYDWDEYLTGKFANGLDVIFTISDGDTIERVLAATGNWGLLYDSSLTGTFHDIWGRPNREAYPDAWKLTALRDAAFYCPPSGVFPETPDDSIYVLLEGQPDATNPGLYLWSGSGFTRFDTQNPYDPPRFYDHFYRDIADSNVLWLVRKADDDGDPAGALLKLSGAYAAAPVEVTLTTSGTVLDVYGFSPWYQSGNPPQRYVYVLAKWTSGSNTFHSVFVLDESDEDNDFIETYRFPEGYEAALDEEIYLTDPYPFKGVVGKPHGNHHHLWLTASNYGVWHVQTDSTAPFDPAAPVVEAQINTEGTGTTKLLRWAPRFFYRDWLHQGTDSTNIILGTHQMGVWYLKFVEAEGNTFTYKWEYEDQGFYGSDVRDMQIYYLDNNLKILAPTFLMGVYRWTGNSWESGGSNPQGANNDPQFNKGIYAGFEIGTTSENAEVYFGSLPEPTISDAFATPDTVYQGGLFWFDDEDSPTLEPFIPNMAEDSLRWYTISDLDGYVKSNGDRVIYLSTGHTGEGQSEPPLSYNVVSRKYNSTWSAPYTYQSPNMGLLCVEPDPRHPDDSVFVGTGNLWTWPPEGFNRNYWGRVIHATYNGATWTANTIYTAQDTFQSVLDITTMLDPDFPGQSRVLAFFALAKGSEVRSAASYYNEGTVVCYKWNPQNSSYQANKLYTTGIPLLHPETPDVSWTKPPAAVTLNCYERGNQSVLVVLVQGDTNGEPIFQSHVYKYTRQGWTPWFTPPVISSNPLHVRDKRTMALDALGGNDVYFSAEGGVYWIDEFTNVNPLPEGSNWHWTSFNCIDPADSLHNLFAGIEDSIEAIHDQYGKRYRPNDNPPIDSIYTWNWMKGYAVRMLGADTLEAVGHPLPYDSSMTLYPECPQFRFNWISYLPTDTMLCDYAFANTDCVLIVKNDQGEFWRPNSADNAFEMMPGEGYQVGVSDTVVHQYPEPQQGQSFTGLESQLKGGGGGGILSWQPEHFVFTDQTIDFYPIYIEDLLVNGQPPQAGDEVGCYATDSLCVGAGAFDGQFPIKIAAWKDDPCTEALDGYTPGQTLSFKFFDVSAGVEVPLEMTLVALQSLTPQISRAYTAFEEGPYAEHRLQASYVLPQSYNLAQNYPNPFNPTTTIRYDLPFESFVHMDIFDLMGRKVTTLVDGKQSAGFRAIYWKGENNFGAQVSSGVYFYRMKAEATNNNYGKNGWYEKTQKMILLK